MVIAKKASKNNKGKTIQQTTASLGRMAQNLKEIRDLYDCGIFSKDEFEAEKQSVFKANGIIGRVDGLLNGVYENMNSRIAISDKVFSMTYEGRIVKVGTVEKKDGNELILKGEDGKEISLKVVGSALVTPKGTRYERE